MGIKFICTNDTVNWYLIDGEEVGLCSETGELIHGDGGNFDCIDNESIAEKASIIDAINDFESGI